LIVITRTDAICFCNYDSIEIINGVSTIKHIQAVVTTIARNLD